jgi:ribosomal protein S12 methylthiotransferase accessory factor
VRARSGCFVPSSNGLDSGNHLLEAINHGICEVIERDANTLFGLCSDTRYAGAILGLDTVDDPGCEMPQTGRWLRKC